MTASWIGYPLFRPGEITEIVGALSSGRTSLLMRALAGLTAAGAVAALVDADDAFDPETAARAGVALPRLLWVRCGGRRDRALRAVDLLVRCPGFGAVVLDAGETPPRLSLGAAFRLKLAARRRGVAVLVVGRRRLAGAGASLAVETVRQGLEWAGVGERPTRLAGMRTSVHVLRNQGAWPSVPMDLRWRWSA